MLMNKMKVSRAWDGSPMLEITLNKAENNAVEELLCIDDKNIHEYDLTILKRRKKRSLDANAYCWSLIGKLAQKLKMKNIDVYRQYIRETGSFTIVPVKEDKIDKWEQIWEGNGIGWLCEDLGSCRNIKGYRNIKCYYGSSAYDSREMAHLIDMIVADCKDQGIETLPPDEIERLKTMWR